MWGKLDPEDNYLISIDGQVRSTWSGKEKLLKLATGSKVYLNFSYHKDGKQTTLKVHRCVAKVFLGDRSAEGLIVLHGEKGALDNSLENLYWGTYSDNNGIDKVRDGTTGQGEKNGRAKLKEADIHKIRDMKSNGILQKEIAALYGVSKAQISNIVRGKRWAHLN